ncbi:MAG: hypothetical protein EZS28_005444 [Streblomastix strix]|uniref:Uncharacterized protein n=1 Tax=Streblomastix strix TaxID=222440 RepID=A0A5J4WVE3_9EUKA|nr:MAG: hypothetical protein EZS28_005444 [Streblomastix strix]
MNKEFYIFAVSRAQDSIASALVKNHGMKQDTQIISKQSIDTRVSDGDVLQQFPLGDDLQLSPNKTLASPLPSRSFRPNPSLKLSLRTITRVQKVQNSQMSKDDQDVGPQDGAQDSSITKYSDRETTAWAQK